MSNDVDFQSGGTNVFWGEIAPCEHIAQFYEHDGMLLDALEGTQTSSGRRVQN